MRTLSPPLSTYCIHNSRHTSPPLGLLTQNGFLFGNLSPFLHLFQEPHLKGAGVPIRPGNLLPESWFVGGTRCTFLKFPTSVANYRTVCATEDLKEPTQRDVQEGGQGKNSSSEYRPLKN